MKHVYYLNSQKQCLTISHRCPDGSIIQRDSDRNFSCPKPTKSPKPAEKKKAEPAPTEKKKAEPAPKRKG